MRWMKMTKSHIDDRVLYSGAAIFIVILAIAVFFAPCFDTSLVLAANGTIYYEPTIRNIIMQDCSQCHSGPSRNLMEYNNLKAYADSGMLAVMVQGPMSQFAGNDMVTILDWVNSGALEKQDAKPAGFTSGNTLVAGTTIYYEPTIKNIINQDCGRCHSGTSRNLMDYDSLKAYADSGMLAVMVQGPMSQFAGNDMGTIVDWVNGGALEKQGATPAAFFSTTSQPAGCPSGQAYVPNVPLNKMTYTNTIQYVLAKDCLGCHSDKFRNLTTYENVKLYVDNGLLKSLVQRGGPMHRFAGPDGKLIILWADNGAPK